MVKIADRHPLKQGLKPREMEPKLKYAIIADRHPLKQGLKPGESVFPTKLPSNRRPTSIKTRIETLLTLRPRIWVV